MKIHQIWINDIIPENIQHMMATVRGSGYEYKLWRKEDLQVYNEELNKAGLNIYHEVMQSDLYMLLILRDFGGLYLDCDVNFKSTLPNDLPKTFCGSLKGDPLMPDPWMIYCAYTNDDQVVSIINDGMKMTNDVDPLHRFGYKAFVRRWQKDILELSACFEHVNLFSWRKPSVNNRRK